MMGGGFAANALKSQAYGKKPLPVFRNLKKLPYSLPDADSILKTLSSKAAQVTLYPLQTPKLFCRKSAASAHEPSARNVKKPRHVEIHFPPPPFASRFAWKPPSKRRPTKNNSNGFDFPPHRMATTSFALWAAGSLKRQVQQHNAQHPASRSSQNNERRDAGLLMPYCMSGRLNPVAHVYNGRGDSTSRGFEKAELCGGFEKAKPGSGGKTSPRPIGNGPSATAASPPSAAIFSTSPSCASPTKPPAAAYSLWAGPPFPAECPLL